MAGNGPTDPDVCAETLSIAKGPLSTSSSPDPALSTISRIILAKEKQDPFSLATHLGDRACQGLGR